MIVLNNASGTVVDETQLVKFSKKTRNGSSSSYVIGYFLKYFPSEFEVAYESVKVRDGDYDQIVKLTQAVRLTRYG